MNQREKLVIAGSLSLGFLYVFRSRMRLPRAYPNRVRGSSAGACGIKRTVEVPSLSSENYTSTTEQTPFPSVCVCLWRVLTPHQRKQ